jgi:putative chitinase
MSLKQIQKQLGVTPDGVLGRQTLNAIKTKYQLSKEQTAMFLGQVCHESNDFEVLEENLNYSSKGLQDTFKKYFPTILLANSYQRNPEKIANRVYANRMGNGDEASGDGWKHRGFGAIQLTGKNNQYKFADYIGDSEIKNNPKIIAEKYALSSAMWFFTVNNLWTLCKTVSDDSIKKLTLKVNGGLNGLEDRKEKTLYFYKL